MSEQGTSVPAVVKLLESPSKQKQFDTCQLLGQLTYIDKWEPKEAHLSLIPRLRGNAFSKACELIHTTLKQGDTTTLDKQEFVQSVVTTAVSLFDRQYEYCLSSGINFKPDVDALVRTELRRVIPLYIANTPFRQHWQVSDVEFSIPSHGCRPDIAGKEPAGYHFVGDMKYKSSLEARYESDTIEEFHWDYQFQQYNEAYRAKLGVGDSESVYSYLFLVVGSPFRIRSVGWVYTPEQRAIWRASAADLTETIRLITSNQKLPRAATTHRSKFGWCPMKKACLEHYLDPELMKRDYVQLKELPE